MNNAYLEKREQELNEQLNALAARLDQIDIQIQKLTKQREQTAADYQATNGALQLTFELRRESAECNTPQ